MTYYDDIYEIAVDNHYLITSKQAAKAGVPNIELVKLAHRGKLYRVSQGVYRLARNVPSPSDAYALAVAQVGEDTYLYGESVLALLELAPTNPAYICVATPARVRRKLDEHIRVTKVNKQERTTFYDGVRSQRAAQAIRACRGMLMPDRLRAAAEKGHEEGYILPREYRELKEEFAWQ